MSLPFPDSSPSGHDQLGHELLRKEVTQRFGTSAAFRDVPFAVLFVLQLTMVLVIALVNGLALGSHAAAAAAGSPPSPPNLERSHDMLLMLAVAVGSTTPGSSSPA